jgi:septum formation protein
MTLVLASASPRRAELLTAAGFSFEIEPANVDETPGAGEPALEYALRVARAKALTVSERCRKPGTVVLAADTVVVAGDAILGKPNDAHDAKSMLKMLSGAVHAVHTAVVLRVDRREWSEIVTTQVRVLPLGDEEINWYVGTGEPQGKAGAYAIQGRAARFIDWIQGSWSNVVGLPIATVHRLLTEAAGHGILT